MAHPYMKVGNTENVLFITSHTLQQ